MSDSNGTPGHEDEWSAPAASTDGGAHSVGEQFTEGVGHPDWERALRGGDDALLDELVSTNEPASSLLVLESYINGTYRATQHPVFAPQIHEVRQEVSRVLPFLKTIRFRLGWQVRDFDIGLLRLIRQSGFLSLVLGAGVSMGAGAPSWPELVRLMLEETLDKGVEISESVPASDNPPKSPVGVLADGTIRISGSGTWRMEQRVREVKRYTPEEEAAVPEVLADVRERGSATDVETLMRGAQLCYELCGQHLFTLLTKLIYSRAREPSETHRAVAELAHGQEIPVGPPPHIVPGWDSIITYNIDTLMSEALADQRVPHAAWALRGDEMSGDPDTLAQRSSWYQPVYHLHGYTPRRLFRITEVPFVFSTSQYLTTYQGPRSEILEAVFARYLANPVHVALYIGCSFTDNAMNGLLRDAHAKYPGRYHYALLKWPREREGREPTAEEIAAESARYLEFGVRPIWFDRFEELPDLVRQLR